LPLDSVDIPGPTLELTRGERVAITVVNRLRTPTAVHWHGIELESYYDGVAGWSGAATRLAPMIAPGDSFVAVFTPPRSGTFMYHAHVGEGLQLTAGMYAPIIVLEPGTRRDARRDQVVLFSALGRSDSAVVGVNGRYPPDTLVLRAGRPNRLRLINITAEDEVAGTLGDDTGAVTWRVVAKDGAARSVGQVRDTRATFSFGPGEIFDVELTPRRGAARLRIASFNNFDIAVVAR
jgi:FtsP/CotA-like multicopper oxidase with cupredoxin domain